MNVYEFRGFCFQSNRITRGNKRRYLDSCAIGKYGQRGAATCAWTFGFLVHLMLILVLSEWLSTIPTCTTPVTWDGSSIAIGEPWYIWICSTIPSSRNKRWGIWINSLLTSIWSNVLECITITWSCSWYNTWYGSDGPNSARSTVSADLNRLLSFEPVRTSFNSVYNKIISSQMVHEFRRERTCM